MSIETLTIADLRNKTSNSAAIYYTTDIGQEGDWYFDTADTSSTDNIGTILVGTNIPYMRFKRIYDVSINVKWFGAKGDGFTDDIAAIQASINLVTKTDYADIIAQGTENYGGGTVFFPAGQYRITKNILVGQSCTLKGVSGDVADYPFLTKTSPDLTGSIIYADFTDDELPEQKWAIQSACYWTGGTHTTGELLAWDEDADINYTTKSSGVHIEGLVIHGNNSGIARGAIKLSTSASSSIKHVAYFCNGGMNIGIMLTACYGGVSIENIFLRPYDYGIVIINCGAVKISNLKLDGFDEHIQDITPLLTFIDQNTDDLYLNDTVKNKACGIYSRRVNTLDISNADIEHICNGMVLIQTSASLSGIHFENIKRYGITIAAIKDYPDSHYPANAIIDICNVHFGAVDYFFFFGSYATVNITGVHISIDWDTYQAILFVPDSDIIVLHGTIPPNRVITFTGTCFYKRYYSPNIVFLDGTPYSQNYGSVYVNPDSEYNSITNPYPGNNENYGFCKQDPLLTFDAALVRVQNQSTINPVKTIYIKAALEIGEGINPWDGAAIKNLDIVSIANSDVLITTYGIDEEANPPHLKGRIYFEGNGTTNAEIGQIELLGNVNLYFKNVDLVCNSPSSMSSGNPKLTMFGLKNSYGRLTFNNESVTNLSYDINLAAPYFLVQANLDSLITVSPLSLIDIKFVNISINGGALSSVQTGIQTLGVDCVQIASTRNGGGWQDAQIIRNNF